jgi:basic membrane protein A
VVGFLGGQTGPLIEKFQAGYEAGVESVCPDCEVLVKYAGSTPEAFNDPGKGKEISLQQISQGADIIYHASATQGPASSTPPSRRRSSRSAWTSTRRSSSRTRPS